MPSLVVEMSSYEIQTIKVNELYSDYAIICDQQKYEQVNIDDCTQEHK